MRTLTPAVQDALAATGRSPVINAQLFDPIEHYSLYQMPAIVEGISATAIADDGAFVRCYTDRPAGAFVASLSVQRITDPSQAAQWAAWTLLSSGNLMRDAGCTISNNGGVLRVFAQSGTSPFHLLVWTSTDNGATWSGPTAIAAVNAIIRGLGSAGQDDIFYAKDDTGGVSLSVSLWNGSAWSAPATWTFGVLPAGLGIDATWDAENSRYLLAASDGSQIAGYSYTPSGPTWGIVGPIAPLDSATSVGIYRAYPRLQRFDSRYCISYLEVDTGAFTGLIYHYARLRQSPDFTHWGDGFLLSQQFAYSPTWLKAPAPPAGSAGPAYYVLNNAFIWRSPLYDPALFEDVSTQVLAVERREQRGKAGQVTLRLSNADGQYNSRPMLGLNTSIRLAEGYHDPTTGEASFITVGMYYVDTYSFARSPAHNDLIITASDATKRLDQSARLQTTYNSRPLSWLLTELAARAGLFALSIPATSQFSQVVPHYSVPAGHTLRRALNDLCTIYSVYYFLDQTETLQFRELSADDAAVWSYQPEIETLTLGSQDQQANHIIVTGRASAGPLVFGESYDFAHINQTGQERPRYHTDPRLTTSAQAALKAGFLLSDEQRAGQHHTITVPANPGLQLLDVVTLTDSPAPAGTSISTQARIVALDMRYDAQQARFDLTLILERP